MANRRSPTRTLETIVLRFASYDGSTWQRETVDENGGLYNHLDHGPDGWPVISYASVSQGGAMTFARFNGSEWTLDTIDSSSRGPSSISYGPDGMPVVAYYAQPSRLNVARFGRPGVDHCNR